MLALPVGKYNVQTFDPKSGKMTKLPMLQSDGAAATRMRGAVGRQMQRLPY